MSPFLFSFLHLTKTILTKTINMKKIILLLLLVTAAFTYSCEKEGDGSITFWIAEDVQNGIEVVIENSLDLEYAKITTELPNGVKNCSTEGCANFTLPEGKYKFKAHAIDRVYGNNQEWNFEISVTPGKCKKVEITGKIHSYTK